MPSSVGSHKSQSRPLVSPSGSLSPSKHRDAIRSSSMSRQRQTESLECGGEEEEDELSGYEEAKTKLEIRREKNRVKQRNLRLRRANQMENLENENMTLRTEMSTLKTTITTLQQREHSLSAWIRDLEGTLYSHQLHKEVASIRSMWADHQPQVARPPTSPRVSDALVTLASAAVTATSSQSNSTRSSRQSSRSDFAPYIHTPPPLEPNVHSPALAGGHAWAPLAEAQKRRRTDDMHYPGYADQASRKRDVLPPINPRSLPSSVVTCDSFSLPSTTPLQPQPVPSTPMALPPVPNAYPFRERLLSPRSHDKLSVSHLISPTNPTQDARPRQHPGGLWQGSLPTLSSSRPVLYRGPGSSETGKSWHSSETKISADSSRLVKSEPSPVRTFATPVHAAQDDRRPLESPFRLR